MKYASYLLNIVLIGALGYIAYIFIYDGNIATASEDRTAVVLTAAEKAEVLGEMRGLLETSQSVLLAATSDDVASIPDIVRPYGMVAVQNESVTLAAKLPLDMKTMGYDAHGAMDALGEMATNGASGDDIVATLAGAMSICVSCHETYRFVAEEDLKKH